MPVSFHALAQPQEALSSERKPREAQIYMVAAQDDASLPDAALAERVRQGDRRAFAALVQRHQRTVFHVAWRYVRNDEDARDLTQATFVKAWQNAATFRGESAWRTWLLQIAVNLSLNHVRDRGRWKHEELGEDTAGADPSLVQKLADAESSEQLRVAVETLPPKQRMVVELRVHEGLSFKEVADIAECSEDAAKANFHYALKKLRSMLGAVRDS